MPDTILVIDTSEVRPGKLEDVRRGMKELAAFVEGNEPRVVFYDVYFNDAANRVTVVQIHPDAASLEYHMKVAGPMFGRFAELLQLLTMDVYGDPSDALLDLLRAKARMLGAGQLTVHRLHAGLSRPPTPGAPASR